MRHFAARWALILLPVFLWSCVGADAPFDQDDPSGDIDPFDPGPSPVKLYDNVLVGDEDLAAAARDAARLDRALGRLVREGEFERERVGVQRDDAPEEERRRVVGVLASCCDSCLLFLATLLLATGLAEKA